MDVCVFALGTSNGSPLKKLLWLNPTAVGDTKHGALGRRAGGGGTERGVERWTVKTLQDKPAPRSARTVTVGLWVRKVDPPNRHLIDRKDAVR